MTLFIGNIPCDWSEEQVRETFRPYGEIKLLQLVKNILGGRETANVYLTFADNEAAQVAIRQLHRKKHLPGAIDSLVVRKENEIIHRKVYVNGTTDRPDHISHMERVFSQYGTIEEVRPANGKGGAVIIFKTVEQGQDAIKAMDGKEMEGYHRPLQVQLSLPVYFVKRDRKRRQEKKRRDSGKFRDTTSGRRIFIGGLCNTVDNSKLRSIFSVYGTIDKANIMLRSDGTTKGCATIVYEAAEHAQEAVNAVDDIAMHHPQIIGRDKSFTVEMYISETYYHGEAEGATESTPEANAASSDIASVTTTVRATTTTVKAELTTVGATPSQQSARGPIRSVKELATTKAVLRKPLSKRVPSIRDTASSKTQYQKPKHIIREPASLKTQYQKSLSKPTPTIGDVVGSNVLYQKALSDHIQAVYSSAVTSQKPPQQQLPCNQQPVFYVNPNVTISQQLLSAISVNLNIPSNQQFPSAIQNTSLGLTRLPGASHGSTQLPGTSNFQNSASLQPSIGKEDDISQPLDYDKTIFVHFIPLDFTESDLRDVFMPYGNVIRTSITIDKETGCSRGSGIVVYDNVGSCKVAIDTLNGMTIGESVLRVGFRRRIRGRKGEPFVGRR